MTVTQFSKNLGSPAWAQWRSKLPDALYGFRCDRGFQSSPLAAGEHFHQVFERFVAGEWVPYTHYPACLAIEDALSDCRIAEIKAEVPVAKRGLSGRVDAVGSLRSGGKAIVEIKTTLGQYALPPNPTEVVQAATYGMLLGEDVSLLIWLRVSLRSRCVSVFSCENPVPLLNQVFQSDLKGRQVA